MNKLKSILVGVDFSASSAAALQQAMRIASWNRSGVKVVHVVDTLVVVDIGTAFGAMQGEIIADLIENARQQWDGFAVKIPGASALPFDVEINSAAATLASRSAEYELLVLGTHGRSGKGAGPIAAGCVRRAKCDVLLVQDLHTQPYTTVIAAVDFSETSHRALEQATRIAAQDNASLYVVHAYSAPAKTGWLVASSPSVPLDSRYRDSLLARLKEFCEPFSHEMSYLKPQFQLVEHQTHGHGIGQFARQIGADLVVLGKRGRTNLRDVFLGSTAERILRDAPCSILAVSPA